MSEETTNQSSEQEVVNEQPVSTETVETTETTPEEYDTIKYNHEEVKIPVSERQTYLQKGYNYDSINTKYEEAKAQNAYLERQAKISGFDNVTDYMKALDDYERQQEIAKEAAKYGVPEDFIRGELKPLKDKIQQYEQQIEQNQAQEQTRQLQTELDKVRAANPDFDNYFEPVRELFAKGYSLADAYRLASYEDKLSSIGQQKEQEVLANVTNRDTKQVLSSKDKPNNLAHSMANASFEDIAAISKRVQAGERVVL
jgi:hypothetical protein